MNSSDPTYDLRLDTEQDMIETHEELDDPWLERE